MSTKKTLNRVGIFAGTFDPVHEGHVAFALRSAEVGKLDKVYFLPEHQPRTKKNVTDFNPRSRALKAALTDHPSLEVLELPETRFSIGSTIPKLRDIFPGSRLNFIMGSDAGYNLPKWSGINDVLPDVELIIGLRAGDDGAEFKEFLDKNLPMAQAIIIASPKPSISSSLLRGAK